MTPCQLSSVAFIELAIPIIGIMMSLCFGMIVGKEFGSFTGFTVWLVDELVSKISDANLAIEESDTVPNE